MGCVMGLNTRQIICVMGWGLCNWMCSVHSCIRIIYNIRAHPGVERTPVFALFFADFHTGFLPRFSSPGGGAWRGYFGRWF